MQPKILTVENYFSLFKFQEQETGCGIEQEPDSGENYFFAQTYFPKTFFNLDHPSLLSNPFIRVQLADLPEKILVKLELIEIGSIQEKDAYIFKPWIIGIDNPMLCNFLESFHLFFPSTLLYNLMERLVFLEQLNLASFRQIRVLQDIPTNTFQRFGLDSRNVERTFESANLRISRIETPDKNEISEFYKQHWEGITNALEQKYFQPVLNTWFRVKLKSTDKTVGFVRLYNTNSSFTGGTSLEYIIDKAYRNKGYATESSLCVIDHLRKYSYAISLGGEVNDNNEYSIKVLKKLGFSATKSSGLFVSDNFYLSLLDPLKNVETEFENNNLELAVEQKMDTFENPNTFDTIKIAEKDFPNPLNWDDAIKACSDLGEGWRLPKLSELREMYKNKNKIGGFASEFYWGSSDYGSDPSYLLNFSDGEEYTASRNLERNVRAVRVLVSMKNLMIIGNSSLKIDNLEIAENDFSARMNWEDAEKACSSLGEGWRLPTKYELNEMYENRNEIGGVINLYYWSSSMHRHYVAWLQNFNDGKQYFGNCDGYELNVRAVRSL